ncbi:serine/threonine protein kinase [Pirellulaceae bacterium]|nr:serine/threonine protein kinase [Pirellulaceae bacterium]
MNSEFQNQQHSTRSIDELCDRFENACKTQDKARIENLVSPTELAQSPELFGELVALEINYRMQAGEVLTEQEYTARFPKHEDLIRDAFEEKNATVDVAPITKQFQFMDSGLTEDGNISGVIPRIQGYRIVKEIGSGGMGVVYQAEQLRPIRRMVAIKVISCRSTKEVLSRFESEWQSMALMKHPSIARVFDAGVTEDRRPFYSMELVEGKPISVFLDEQNYSLKQRLNLFRSVCMAVHHAHRQGILHRDLKPNNILVTLADRNPLPKIIDFGLAKSLMPEQRLSEQTVVTEEGRILGTLEYMSPEQASGSSMTSSDTRTDVYSLGLVLYRLLAGTGAVDKVRWQKLSLEEILKNIREDEPTLPSRVVAESSPTSTHLSGMSEDQSSFFWKLRRDLDWIVMRAIAKEPDRRYQSAEALADDIERFQQGDSISARPPSLAYRFQKSFRKNRAAFVGALTVLATLIVGIISTLTMYLESVKEKEKAVTAGESLAMEVEKVRRAEQLLELENGRLKVEEELTRKANLMLTSQLSLNAWQNADFARTQSYYDQVAKVDKPSSLEWRIWENRLRTLPKPVLKFDDASAVKIDPKGEWIFLLGKKTIRRINRHSLTTKQVDLPFFDNTSMGLSADGMFLAVRGLQRVNNRLTDGIVIISTDSFSIEKTWTTSKYDSSFSGAQIQFGPDNKIISIGTIRSFEQWNIEDQELILEAGYAENVPLQSMQWILDMKVDSVTGEAVLLTNLGKLILRKKDGSAADAGSPILQFPQPRTQFQEMPSAWKFLPMPRGRTTKNESVQLDFRNIVIRGKRQNRLQADRHYHVEPPHRIALTSTNFGSAALLATVSNEEQVKIWILNEDRLTGHDVVNGVFDYIIDLQFFDDQTLVILNRKGELFCIDLLEEELRHRMPSHYSGADHRTYDFQIKGNRMISLSWQGELECRDISTNKTLFRRNCLDKGAPAVLARAANTEPWEFLYAGQVSIKPNGNQIMIRLPGGTVEILDPSMKTMLHSIDIGEQRIVSSAWHNHGILVVTDEGELCFDELGIDPSPRWHKKIANGVSGIFSDPNSDLVVLTNRRPNSKTNQKFIEVYRIPADPREHHRLELTDFPEDAVLDCRFCNPKLLLKEDPNSATNLDSVLVTGHQSGKVRFWKVTPLANSKVELLWEWNVSSSSIFSIEILQEEKRILIADQRGFLRVLNLAEEPFEVLQLTANYSNFFKSNQPSLVRVQFDETGQRILALDSSGNLLQWSIGFKD